LKALSGFYYVLPESGGPLLACRGRGKLRHDKVSPLVGDYVRIAPIDEKSGRLDEVLPRRNEFHRPAVANIDQMVMIAANTIPVTDPFLIDRVFAFAEHRGAQPVLVINKWDLVQAEELLRCYQQAGYRVFPVSAETGEGLAALLQCLTGKVSAFTGNSGVGKSSILNRLSPEANIAVSEVSDKLGRGRHTTRHVELHELPNGAIVADTPGFSSLDALDIPKTELAEAFRDFRPYLDQCYYNDCAHRKERGCGVLAAMEEGKIAKSRHDSYLRLYLEAAAVKDWEKKS
jgi:ribosome small subunit-dependent GTPase A